MKLLDLLPQFFQSSIGFLQFDTAREGVYLCLCGGGIPACNAVFTSNACFSTSHPQQAHAR